MSSVLIKKIFEEAFGIIEPTETKKATTSAKKTKQLRSGELKLKSAVRNDDSPNIEPEPPKKDRFGNFMQSKPAIPPGKEIVEL